MLPSRAFERGVVLALFTIFLWAIIDVLSRYVVTELRVHPWSFASIQMVVAGIGMMIIGGRGKSGWGTLRHKYTWIIGFLRVLKDVLFIIALTMITATETTFLESADMLFVLLFAWVFMGRAPSWRDLPAILLVGGGVLYIILNQGDGFSEPAVWLGLGAGLCMALMTLFTELHDENKKAIGIRARCRYTGVVVLVTGLFFLLMMVVLTYINEFYPAISQGQGLMKAIVREILPLEALLHTETLLIGTAAGLLLRAPVMYCTYASIQMVKSETYILLMALLPFVTLVSEMLVAQFTALEMTDLSGGDIAAGVLLVVGSALTVWLRLKAEREVRAPVYEEPIPADLQSKADKD